MKLPHPFNSSPLPAYPSTDDEREIQRFVRQDSKVRVHNMARRVALIATKTARAQYLDELARKHGEDFIIPFRRILRWYWRSQRKLQRGG